MKLDLARALRQLSIAQQVMVLIVVALAVALAMNIAIVASLPPPPRTVTDLGHVLSRLQSTLPAIRAAKGKDLDAALERASDRTMRFEILAEPPRTTDNPLSRAIARRAAEQLDLPLESVRSGSGAGAGFFRAIIEEAGTISPNVIAQVPLFGSNQLAVEIGDNRWLGARPPRRPEDRLWLNYVGLWFFGSALLLTPLALWFANRLAAPIGRFAAAAERLGRDPNAAPLAEEGPREVSGAVAAFNTMRGRIRRFVADRTLMLAAISHDLRTPLQRMRFRVESLPEDIGKDLLADIEEMETMLSSTLAFARDDAAQSTREPLDLGALVESVCDDAEDAGQKACCNVAARVVVQGDPVRLKRVIANLVTNAIKFGGAAEVSVSREAGQALVEVADRGPGIPEDLREEVFQPFRRLEPSRSKATGGVGLGLAIARTIARGHGGDVSLHPREGGGLIARLALPA
ncbi:MAG TPA: ATP-binding protein [Caulobacterales bacterium]|nr:ATP-binding protein [Caulobacterales bacterium]